MTMEVFFMWQNMVEELPPPLDSLLVREDCFRIAFTTRQMTKKAIGKISVQNPGHIFWLMAVVARGGNIQGDLQISIYGSPGDVLALARSNC